MVTRSVQFGRHCVTEFGPAGTRAMLTPLTDSSSLLAASDWAGLRAALRRVGYLFLQGALPASQVDAAQSRVLSTFAESGGSLDSSRLVGEGVLQERCCLGCVPFMEGRSEMTHSAPLLQVFVFDGERIKEIFAGVLGSATRSFDFKWLRAIRATRMGKRTKIRWCLNSFLLFYRCRAAPSRARTLTMFTWAVTLPTS
ncbi:unnamed protein product [Prorocentrum cordatum]|uniref:Uncharacterized protein n=1 Tax=Prorocentrum cordatum TaxID=2364126 RepID=A0ABN9UB54_9DINO|nr:unnamed protein product [Polarella glacialis]